MKKQSLRSFGFGLLAAAAALFLFNYTSKDQLLEKDHYTVLTTDELHEKMAKTIPVETTSSAEKKQITKKESAASKSKEITVTIEAGMSSDDVINALKKANVITDEKSFNTYLTENGYTSKLQVGTFTFSANMSNEEIASALVK